METICPTTIDSLVQIWTALHKELVLEIDRADARYLRDVAFGLDDELVARLMAAKLALAQPGAAAQAPGDTARCGSMVLFSVQGRQRRVRLVHGNVDNADALGVATRFGAALVGLRQGDSLLWPSEQGRLVEVRALEVAARDRAKALVRTRAERMRVACASG